MTSSPDTITIPARVRQIMQLLIDAGHQAHIVGGCVRDRIMNRPVIDHDITTSATPIQIKEVFSSYKLIDFGERHGTIGVYDHGQTYEITTYRIEGGYSDGRRPDSVTFVDQLDLDLARRDFTINAMAADIDGVLIDPYGGSGDISVQTIRAVGDAHHRFREDSLRILRAYRFALRFDFKLDDDTAAAITDTNHLLIEHSITGERIGVEFNEIMRYGGTGITLMYKLGTLQTLFPFLHLDDTLNSILPRYSHLSTVSADVNLAIFVEPTYNQLEKPKEKKKLLSNIFEVVKGWGIYRQTKIKTFLDHGKLPDVILSTKGNAELLRWINCVFSSYKTKKDSVYTADRDELISYASSIAGQDLSLLTSRIDQVAEILAKPLPVNGHDAQSLGFEGPQIAAIINIWQYLAHYLGFDKPEQFTDFITTYEEYPGIDVQILRSEISDNNPKYTDEEDQFLIKLIHSFQILKKPLLNREDTLSDLL